MMKFHLCVLALFLLIPGLLPMAATAQQVDLERSRYSAASYYNYSEPGDVTIVVNVWGTVRNPGLYEIPVNTRLGDVLSLAGGPSIGARNRRTERRISIRLARSTDQGQEVILSEEMQNEIFPLENNPELLEGDIVTVETLLRQGFSIRDIFPIVAAIASVALAVERISQ